MPEAGLWPSSACSVRRMLVSLRPLTRVWCARRAKDLVSSNIEVLHKTADILMEREQIDGDEFLRIIMESQAEQYLKADEPSMTVPYQPSPAAA